MQQKFLKRPAEDHDPGGGDQQSGENFEPPVKLQCTAQQHNSHQNDQGLTKFSVEIVQQLEFTTSAANSQPQQISTNVTVKTHANASVKSDVSSPKSNPSTPASGVAGMHQKSNIGLETLVECVKQEPDNDFADLDQCAAALEKDAAANGGAGFGGFSDLIGDDTNDEIISSATFNDLISDISNYPDYELMKDFDFDDKSESNSNTMKVEDNKDLLQNVDNTNKMTHSPLLQNQNNYSPPVFENQTIKNRLPGYSNMDFTKTELSPAAQTLKHMAEQHQHQKQMGLSFNPSTRTPSSRSPYPDFQFQGDYGSPNSNSSFHKNSPNFPQPDMIKQELIFQGNEFDMKRKTSSAAAAAAANMYKPQQQQYSPYGSPGGGHGSPGYLPRGAAQPSQGQFGGGTPPRPPSGPGQGNSNGNGPSVQINQAQQLNVSQQGHGHSIQVSAGQHVHLSGDLKGNVSIAAQQGMHFQHNSNSNQSQGTNSGNHHAHNQQPSPMPAPQHQGSPMGGGMGGQMGGPMMPNAQQMGQQQQSMQSGLSGTNGGLGSNVNMGGPLGGMAGPNNGLGSNGMGSNSGMGPNGGMGGPGGMPSGMGNMHPGMQHVGGIGHQNDSYSLSQTQTINFTQQSLRRAGGPGVPNMGSAGPGSNLPSMPGQQQPSSMGGPRLISAQSLEQQQQQQKLLHQQQQMLRAQQQYMAAARPPPPDYKASAAGMIQSGMQPRYAGSPGGPPPIMRRVGAGHQPMPPSGPMIRSNMYMLQQQQQHQQQQMPQRASLYSRQQGPMGVGIESVQQHSQAEWRHLLMTQQQNGGFNTMRPNFQQGFNLNSGSMHQMTALQHQQIRMGVHQQQQGMGGQSQQQGMNAQNQLMVQGGGGGPMAQMNNMNQAVLHMQQQQQQQQHSLVQQQQQNSHMTMSSIHMQQSQSISVTNQSIQQQNNLAEQLSNASSNNQNNALSNFNPQADFNFEFLDNLGAGDSTAFTDQELLNSFDSDAGFNLDF